MNELLITIPGKPIAKKRPRFARRGKFVTTYNDQQTEFNYQGPGGVIV
jgi:Holliday junction resolvase RusA-like endonuclease